VNKIAEVEEIEGYIDAFEINNTFINIDKHVVDQLPLESIMVPEDQFVGMYDKIPLISYSNMDQLIRDSIVTYPDSLLLQIEASNISGNHKEKANADSMVSAFLNKVRIAYNDSLIDSYRDSVMYNYRVEYREDYASKLRKSYNDSVAKVNMVLLTRYNDSISKELNSELVDQLKSVLDYVNQSPNNLTVYNLFNEASTLPLQNDGLWYQWIWLKNAQKDSIGIRVENLSRQSMRVLIDESVNLSRLTQRQTLGVDRIQPTQKIEQKLKTIKARTPEVSNWTLAGKMYGGLTQTFINPYWSNGGNSTASALSTFSYDANYSKSKLKWENGVDAKLGLIYYIEEDDDDALRDWHKNSDNFEMNSRLGISAFKNWYYSAEANFQTQFFRGYSSNTVEEISSSIFSPAYLTFSGGFEYTQNTKFSAFISPLSLKTTYVTNPDVDETTYGIDEGETRSTRVGVTGKVDYEDEIFENVNISTENTVFFNFGSSDGEWQLFKMPDVDTETTIDFKLNQFITAQINIHFVYDKDVVSSWTDSDDVEQTGTRLQLKEFLTLGASYTF
jgi:hypothetical protein